MSACASAFFGAATNARARVHLDKALKLSPNDAPKLTWAAETARRLGDPAKALQLAKRALRSSPGAFAANAMVGSALNDLGRHEEALAHLDTELRVAPDNQANHYAHLWRAAAFHGLGRRDDMLAALDAALEFNPQFDLLLVRRAVEYVRDGEPDQAQACLGRLRASIRALGPGIHLARRPEGLRLGVEQTATLENLWPTAERDGA